MSKQHNIFYKAMLARDYRFDGKFFVAVKTTGIYCRPICPAKPQRKNVEFYNSAWEAEKNGYRACLRCHPESAPLSPAWIGKSAIVNRGLKLIYSGEYQATTRDEFAKKLGVSARHLQRLFQEDLGMTPKQLADHYRLDFARKLIVETSVSITEIAFISGFSSVRRFNDVIKKKFSKSPSEIRKNSQAHSKSSLIKLSLAYRPPFDWSSLLSFYKSHEISGIEQITDDYYSRVFSLDGNIGAIRVHSSSNNELLLEIAGEVTPHLYHIVQKIRQMFDLNCDPVLIANAFESSGMMTQLYEKYPGVRLPKCWDPFEMAICTILGQLVSVAQAKRLVQQLVSHYGTAIEHPISGETRYKFPTPEVLAKHPLTEVRTTQKRRETIQNFASLVANGQISLLSAQDPETFKKDILNIKGIGPWTAEYMALRVLGDTNAFPGTDLILKRVLQQHPNLDIAACAPWRSYAALYLWKEFAGTLPKSNETKAKPKQNKSKATKSKPKQNQSKTKESKPIQNQSRKK